MTGMLWNTLTLICYKIKNKLPKKRAMESRLIVTRVTWLV